MRHARQSSESIEIAAVLALSGGLMDAYSYLGRGGVFANAQTGNILLLGVSLAQGAWDRCLHYALPVACFAVGIGVAHSLKLSARPGGIHWRQAALVFEIVVLAGVSLIPSEQNLWANSLTSLACGIQVQAFRKLHGHAIATTMCIGNLRSGTQDLVTFFRTQDRGLLASGALYYFVIVCFVAGAVVGSALLGVAGLGAILASPALLAVAFAIMLVDREKRASSRRKRVE